MAEEKKPDEGSGGGSGGKNRRRKGRRRYFRRRGSNEEQQSEKSEKKGKGQSGSGSKSNKNKKKTNERARNDRRRRRRRRPNKDKAHSGPSIIDEIKKSYTPPESIFVYTHVNRIDQRDSGYEYRPEHFSHTGRTTADFRINLTSLYDGILDPKEAPADVQDDLNRLAAERPFTEPVDIYRDFEPDYAGGYDDELPENEENSSVDPSTATQ